MPVTVDSLHHLDPRGRCAAIAEYWPEFPELVIARFNVVWEANESHKHRAGRRWEAFQTSANPGLPEPAFYGWEKEIFETCFQAVLSDLSAELWKRGEPSQRTLETAGSIAIPEVWLDIALEFSRTARPALTLPRDVSESIAPARAVAADSEFDGWYQIGYCEEELIDESFREESPASYVQAVCGLVVADTEEELEDVRIPLAQGERMPIWANVPDAIAIRLRRLRNSLVCGMYHQGFTIRGMILAAHPVVVAGLGLRMGSWPGRLCLMDKHEQVGVVLRAWRTDPVDADVVGHVYRLTGCDLLLRADLYSDLESQFGDKLKVAWRTFRR